MQLLPLQTAPLRIDKYSSTDHASTAIAQQNSAQQAVTAYHSRLLVSSTTGLGAGMLLRYHDTLSLQVQDNEQPQRVVVENAHTQAHGNSWKDTHQSHLVGVCQDDLAHLCQQYAP